MRCSLGPSLCIRIDGLVLSANELCELQNPVTPFHLQGMQCHYGFGLQSCYLITDLPMIISGDGFFLWDPTGKLLGTSTSDHVPQGRHYKHVGSDLMDRCVIVMIGMQQHDLCLLCYIICDLILLCILLLEFDCPFGHNARSLAIQPDASFRNVAPAPATSTWQTSDILMGLLL